LCSPSHPAPPMTEPAYRFGKFELCSGELHTEGLRVPLQEKPLLLLTVLLENSQHVVTREQLRQRMWRSDTFVDYEQGINVAIKKLRDSLGDSADRPQYVETIAKKGYRLLVQVELVEPLREKPKTNNTATAVRNDMQTGAGRIQLVRKRWIASLLVTAFLAALVLLLVYLQAGRRTAPRIKSIAVLPLQNLSADPEQEYFADGITEELITNLAQSLPLRVISRTSVMRYKRTTEPISQIARELGVDAIVEGAVARSGSHVTVTAQLINAAEDRHLWAQTYDRKLEDLLAMEAELSREIATQVGSTLGSQHEVEPAMLRRVDPRAHELYLKGRYFWNKRTDEGGRKAAEYFRQATNLDPNYAPAYVGLADCYLFGQPPTVSPKVLATNIKQLANRALVIDDSLGEAHATLGLLAQNFEWNWAEAEREYKLAINLNPNYATAYQWYAEELELTGRFDEALEEMNRASNLDPLSLIIIKDTGEIYYVAHKYDRAIAYFRKALEMDPNFVVARVNLGLAYAEKREFSGAIAELQRALQLQDTPDVLCELGYVYALSGRRQEADTVLRDLKVISQQRYVFATNYALIYAGLGDKDDAFGWLEKGYRERGLLVGLKVDPHWDNLRTDARFADLMKRVGLVL